ncbi:MULTISPECIES: hypothetical protein [unclassified Nostoc]|uniref:hypothetical protein n=1 Tax=unclassified Nostoc TaxID=2593658 RepID=UPI002AD21E70|nr:hypothetical protein [Nostoc sp. DedQUE03]MDZ7975078.1 hypothetical protein [Nostoc sp. DedQUE03]MDZ8043990.1 hypothetical protein [Nostoc sp. DedQUE02]
MLIDLDRVHFSQLTYDKSLKASLALQRKQDDLVTSKIPVLLNRGMNLDVETLQCNVSTSCIATSLQGF